MSETLKVVVDRPDVNVAVLRTDGYINNTGGEEIAKQAYALLGSGVNRLLLDLEKTKIVNSIGISILIEILEKLLDQGGKLAFCRLTPTIEKTFQIMGLAQYARIFPAPEPALAWLRGETDPRGAREARGARPVFRSRAALRWDPRRSPDGG
jgi:anti-anti-sigma factor